MATALARGCVQANLVAPEAILAADPFDEALTAFGQQVPGAQLAGSNSAVLAEAGVVLLAVKPQKMPEVLEEIQPLVQPHHVLVSIAAGITLQRLAAGLPKDTRLVRVMPNTPCLVGLGASCFSLGNTATVADGQAVKDILGSVGEAFEVEEALLDAVTGLSGSGPGVCLPHDRGLSHRRYQSRLVRGARSATRRTHCARRSRNGADHRQVTS